MGHESGRPASCALSLAGDVPTTAFMTELLPRIQAALAKRYAIQRELGHGGMAVVFYAEDRKHHRPVAVKVLRPELGAVIGSERFLREIEIAAQLTHPHILPLYDSGAAVGLLYYVMPYVEGESLRDRLEREKQLPLDDALQIAREVADALSFAHSYGVVHRDVKPENILLEAGHAVVSDFGIAHAITAAGARRITQTGVALGTPAYMSPEQAAAETELDGRSDVYSLGCVLYEMLAGQPPFTGPTLESVVHQHLTADPPPVSSLRPTVPAEVRGAVARALAKTPADRFTTAAAFAEALTARGAVPSGPGRARGRRLGAKGAIAALAFLTLGGVWALWVRLRGSDSAATPAAVAVLYFDNLSRDTADAYLADGLTEATIVRLGQLERLAVKSRDAVRRYRGSPHEDPTALGRALSVGYLASGSVQRVGSRVRVTVDLVRAATGVQVWGQQYDRTAADLLTIEEDIAREVTRSIAGRLLPAEQAVLAARPTRVPEAYDRFLRGNYYLAERTARSVTRAIQEYEAAVRLDPGFTEALARIAYGDGLILYWGWDYPGVARDSLLARGLAATERALRQDSTSSDAWMARGFLLTYEYPHTYDGMRAAFQRAIALDPRNAEAHHQYAGMLAELGDDSAAVAACHRALVIEPDRPITLVQLADLRLSERRYAEGRRWLDSALARDPAFQFAYAFRALLELHLGELAAARRDGETAVRLSPAITAPGEAVLAMLDAAAGDSGSARARVARLVREVPASDRPTSGNYWLSAALVAVGERERALALLERIRPRGIKLWFYLRYPEFDPLRGDPRFQQIFTESRPPAPSRAS